MNVEVKRMTAVTVRLEDKDKQALDEMCSEMGKRYSRTILTLRVSR